MPRRRPFFEYKGFSGLWDSINRITVARPPPHSYDSYSVPLSDETPMPPRDHRRRNHRSRRRNRRHRGRSSQYRYSSSRSRPSRYHDRHRRYDYYQDRDYRRERNSDRRLQDAEFDERGYDSPSTDPINQVSVAQTRANDTAAAAAFVSAAKTAKDVGQDTGNTVVPNGQSQMGSAIAPPRSYGRSGARSERSEGMSGVSGGGRTYASSRRFDGQARLAKSHASRSITSRVKEGVKGLIPSRFRSSQNGDDGYMLDDMTEGGQISRPQLHSERSSKKKSRKRKRWLKTAALVAALGFGARWLMTRNKGDKGGEHHHGPGPKKHNGGDDDDDDDDDVNGRSVRRANPFKLEPPNAFGVVRVPQGEAYIIERSGKYHRKLTAGSSLLVPFVDRVAFRHTLREIGVPIHVQACVTQDSVDVQVKALMFLRIEDPVAASYGVDNLHRSLMMMTTTCMSEEISQMTLEDLFKHRQVLNKRIASLINGAARPWGIRCTRFDLKDMIIPEEIRISMSHAAEAEQMRRADILFSEGQRAALINRADGEMQAQMRLSQARQMDIVNQAIGEAHAIQERGEAIANAMREVAEVVNGPGGKEALQLRIAEQYGNAYTAVDRSASGESAHYPHDPAHMADAMNNAIGLLSVLGDPHVNAANPKIVPQSRVPAPTNNINHNIPTEGEYDGYYEEEEEEEDDDDDEEEIQQQLRQRYDDMGMYNGYEGYTAYDGHLGDDRQKRRNGLMRTAHGATYYDDRDMSPEESDAAYESQMRSPRRSSVTPGHGYRFNSSGRTSSL